MLKSQLLFVAFVLLVGHIWSVRASFDETEGFESEADSESLDGESLLQAWADILVAHAKATTPNQIVMPSPSFIEVESTPGEAAPASSEGGASGEGEASKGPKAPTYTFPRSLVNVTSNVNASVAENKSNGGTMLASSIGMPALRKGFPAIDSAMGRGAGQYAFLRGVVPGSGFFKQSKECDMAMRVWLTQCAFTDRTHIFYADNDEFDAAPVDNDIIDGRQGEDAMRSSVESTSTASYIGNMLANANAEAALGEYSFAAQKMRGEHEAAEEAGGEEEEEEE